MEGGDIIIDAVAVRRPAGSFARGKIDAGLQPFPLSYESEDAGFSNLGRIATYVPDYEFTAVFLDPAWAPPTGLPSRRASRVAPRQAAMATNPTPPRRSWSRSSAHEAYARRGHCRRANFKLDARRARGFRCRDAAGFHDGCRARRWFPRTPPSTWAASSTQSYLAAAH